MATTGQGTSRDLLRAYLEAVTLSEEIQTELWRDGALTLTQVRALRRLGSEPKSLGQLGQELALAPPAVTKLADRLEERGLVERSRNHEDRRKVLLSLTPDGIKSVSAALPLFTGSAIRAATDRMRADERAQIAAAFRQFTASVRQAEKDLAAVASAGSGARPLKRSRTTSTADTGRR